MAEWISLNLEAMCPYGKTNLGDLQGVVIAKMKWSYSPEQLHWGKTGDLDVAWLEETGQKYLNAMTDKISAGFLWVSDGNSGLHSGAAAALQWAASHMGNSTEDGPVRVAYIC